jgi:hypothetical protein
VVSLFFGILAEMLVRLQHDLRDPSASAVDEVFDSHADAARAGEPRTGETCTGEPCSGETGDRP